MNAFLSDIVNCTKLDLDIKLFHIKVKKKHVRPCYAFVTQGNDLVYTKLLYFV